MWFQVWQRQDHGNDKQLSGSQESGGRGGGGDGSTALIRSVKLLCRRPVVDTRHHPAVQSHRTCSTKTDPDRPLGMRAENDRSL